MEPLRITRPACLGRSRPPSPFGGAVGRKRRSRSQGAGLLWPASLDAGQSGRRAQEGLVTVCARASGQRDHDPVSGVVLPEAGSVRENRDGHDLGQCVVACQPRGPGVEADAQSAGQARAARCPSTRGASYPIKSPWLNAIEPHWIYAKRKVGEADRLLPA